MRSHDLVSRTPRPRTRGGLAQELRALGLNPGIAVLVHASLRSLGWVCGGAVAVIQALQDVIGPKGTLVMPTFSTDLTDPADWRAPPVPKEWLETIRATMPAFDPARTPTNGMGVISESFRTWPGVRRSLHPVHSFAALGRRARDVTDDHALEDPFGEASPLARLYALDAMIVLMGVGYERCTALHLAERRAQPDAKTTAAGAPVTKDGVRQWITYGMPPADAAAFPAIGQLLDAEGLVAESPVGSARCRYLPLGRAVDLAAAWLSLAPSPG